MSVRFYNGGMIRQALRSLLRARAFSVIVLTVAPGIGVNTAIFSVIYSTHSEFPSFQVAAPD
jgi:hypothetical protein